MMMMMMIKRLLEIIFIYLVAYLLIQPRKPHKRDMLSDFCVCSQARMLYKLLSLFIYFMSTLCNCNFIALRT